VRFTNKRARWKGETVAVTVKVMRPVLDEMDAHVGEEDLPNRSAIMQDALARWLMTEEARNNGNGSSPA
jgi:metal-responsive CopG/Arc/MetJ family transcriptional regulator